MVARKMRTNTRKWQLASGIAGPFLHTVWSRVTEAWLKRQRSPCSPWVVARMGWSFLEDCRKVFGIVWEIAKYQTVNSPASSPRNARSSSSPTAATSVVPAIVSRKMGSDGQAHMVTPEQIGTES